MEHRISTRLADISGAVHREEGQGKNPCDRKRQASEHYHYRAAFAEKSSMSGPHPFRLIAFQTTPNRQHLADHDGEQGQAQLPPSL